MNIHTIPKRPAEAYYTSRTWLLSGFCVLISILIDGYRFGSQNQSFYIPIIRFLQAGKHSTKDILYSFARKYPSMVYRFVAYLNLTDYQMEVFFFAGFVIFLWVFYFYLLKLYFLITDDKDIAAVSVLIIAFGMCVAVGPAKFKTYFEHGTLGLPLVSGALYAFFLGKYMLSYLLLGILLNIHGLYSVHLFIIFSLYIILNYKSIPLKYFLKCTALFLVLGIPIFTNKLLHREAAPNFDLWVSVLRSRMGYQIFPTLSRKTDIFIILVFAAFIAIIYISRQMGRIDRNVRDKLLYFLVVPFVMVIPQYVFTEIYPLRIFFQLMLTRIFLFMYLLYLPVLVCYLMVKAKNGCHEEKIISYATLYLFFAKLNYMLFSMLIIHYVYRYGGKILKTDRSRFFIYAGIVLAGIILMYRQLAYNPSMLHFALWKLTGLAVFLAVITRMSWRTGIAAVPGKFFRSDIIAAALIAFTVQVFYSKVILAENIYQRNFDIDPPWYDVQVWCRNNTPPDAVIATPPFNYGFRIYSHRTPILEWKDGGILSDSYDLSMAYLNRFDAVKNWPIWSADHIKGLKENYGIRYIIFPAYKNVPWKTLYFNEKYKVVSVDYDT